jgi:hypothetical protein
MKIRGKYLWNIVIGIFLLVVTLMAGCKSQTTTTSTTHPDETLTFTPRFGTEFGPYQDEASQILVTIDTSSVSKLLSMVYSYDADTLLKVDYTHYFVTIAFNGYRGGIFNTFKILNIERKTDGIYVTASFDDGGSGYSITAHSSQYQAVQLDRNILPKAGTITFNLLDESGHARARTVLDIVNK